MRKECILRIDEDLYEEVKKLADKNERSVNAQIVYTLKKEVEKDKEKETKKEDNTIKN